MKKILYSIKDIRLAYEQAEDTAFYRYSLARYFFRPISFYGAWFFLRLGITANQTTFLSWLFVFFGCSMYLFIDPSKTWIPFLLILGWAFLDYIDGCIARVSNNRTKYGHFIDVVGAYFMLAYFPICLGVGLYHFPDNSLSQVFVIIDIKNFNHPSINLLFGAFASINNILLRLIVLRMQTTFNIDPRIPKDGVERNIIAVTVGWVEALISPRGLFFPAFMIATAIEFLELFLFSYFLIYSAALISYVCKYSISLRK